MRIETSLLLGHADGWYSNHQILQRSATVANLVGESLELIDAAIGEEARSSLRLEGAQLDDASADAVAWQVLGGGMALSSAGGGGR